jgi:cytochrome c biogenesis protein CcmG/thiol:disulfide interchange protein DsbE
MKKWLLKKSNLLFTLLFSFALIQQIPLLKNNFSHENELIKTRSLAILNQKKNILMEFPPKTSRSMVIFWASWCGPCKIEMLRLKKSVESGAIPKEAIFAINPFESNTEARKFIDHNNYPFTFLEASSLPTELGVRATPTTLFIEDSVITKMSSGMSIWGIWEAEFYL